MGVSDFSVTLQRHIDHGSWEGGHLQSAAIDVDVHQRPLHLDRLKLHHLPSSLFLQFDPMPPEDRSHHDHTVSRPRSPPLGNVVDEEGGGGAGGVDHREDGREEDAIFRVCCAWIVGEDSQGEEAFVDDVTASLLFLEVAQPADHAAAEVLIVGVPRPQAVLVGGQLFPQCPQPLLWGLLFNWGGGRRLALSNVGEEGGQRPAPNGQLPPLGVELEGEGEVAEGAAKVLLVLEDGGVVEEDIGLGGHLSVEERLLVGGFGAL